MAAAPINSPVLLAGTLLIAGVFGASSASASTCVWTGATDAAWSNAGNWTGCAGNAPVNADTLQFPEVASNKSSNNDLALLTDVTGLAFTGDTSGYTLSGNALALGAAGLVNSNTGGMNSIDINLTLSAPQSFSGGLGSVVLNGGLDLGGQDLTIAWPGVAAGVPWTIAGTISGSGSIVANGLGADTGLRLSGANTFAGPVSLSGGYTLLDSPTALGVADGTAANGVSVGPFATLDIGVGIDIGNEWLGLASGAGQSNNGLFQHDGINSWSGPLQLMGAGKSELNSLAGETLYLTGQISGSGGLDLSNAPSAIYQLDNPANDFSGGVVTSFSGATIRLGNNDVLPNASAVTLSGNSTFDTNGFNETIASLSCTATDSVILSNGNQLQVGGDNTDRTCAASFSDPSADPSTKLDKIGTGVLRLTGNSTFAGEVNAFDGGIQIDGSFPPDSNFWVNAHTTLSGTGTVGVVSINGGDLHGGTTTTPGTLTTAGLSIKTPGTLHVRINSAMQYDQIRSTSVILVRDAAMIPPNLDVSLGYVPLAGTVFTLIDNTGASPTIQDFNNLLEGASLMVNGIPFIISYIGGDGNDVTLTAGTGGPAPSIAYTPDGGAAVSLSPTGTGSIAALAVDFQPGTSATISNCSFGPNSAAFPASAFAVTNPTFAAPNGSIAVACTGQAAIVSGLMTCDETIDGATRTPRWPIDCPAALPGVAPTAALAAATATLVNGSGFMGVDVLSAGTAPGALSLDCSIAAAGANFQINSGATRAILATAALGSNAPAIGLSCAPQSILRSSTLTCSQTALPGPNPTDLTATIHCPAFAVPNPVAATSIPALSELGRWLTVMLLLAASLVCVRQQQR